jgi:hypothetical protein
MKEAVQLCLDAEDEVGEDELHFVGVQRIAV